MGEIEKLALACYNATSRSVQKDLVQCLGVAERSLDDATIEHFVKYLKDMEGCEVEPGVLKELNVSVTDKLGFKQFLTVYYAAKTRKHCCNRCGEYLKGVYFTCFQCFRQEDKTYNLCIDCYGKQHTCRLKHAAFRDNCTLLHSLSNEAKVIDKVYM